MYLCCGDSLFDLFSGPSTDPHGITLDGHVGGSPLNVALGLSRMGNHSRFLTRVSTDMFGRRIAAFMKENGIDDSPCVETSQNTTLAVIGLKDDNSADYVFYTSDTADCSVTVDDLPTTLDPDIRVVHFGSYSTVIEPTATALATLAVQAAADRFVSYDPNLRIMVEPDVDLWRERVTALSKVAAFVKASDEDVLLLHPGKKPDIFASEAISNGADLVCITLGSGGALAFSADGREIRVPGVSVDVADTVGAGDTFQAACLHWLGAEGLAHKGEARRADLEAMARFAVNAAALTCSRRGADLPTLADIQAFATS
ncbi:carbohydrate kinase family protein [Oricola cellulosilytica]|uniref:Carbohydrate kinase n=1 Tax=Oricola cellulosilytica TaxID=1429082 RepID=A0A4R0PHR0_9HYPH|nr:carbohydrate kinase [Oricola cellulosilytica]TCD16110.1 carbohydrate kinase [Oricola cellulosilytica]